MKAHHLVSSLAIAAALAATVSDGIGAVAVPKAYIGMAIVTAASPACVAAKWTVGRQISVLYRESIDLSHPRPAMRFSDATFSLLVTEASGSGSWSGPSGKNYNGELTDADIIVEKFTGFAKLTIFTSSAVTNARYMPTGEWTNWANVANCTLTMRATMVQR